MTKKKINKKTKTKMMCFKDTTYSIFLTSRELKNIKYGISSKLFHIFHKICHQKGPTGYFTPGVWSKQISPKNSAKYFPLLLILHLLTYSLNIWNSHSLGKAGCKKKDVKSLFFCQTWGGRVVEEDLEKDQTFYIFFALFPYFVYFSSDVWNSCNSTNTTN